MTTTFRYADEILAGFPDNQAKLITAENLRDFVVSTKSGGAQIIEETTFVVPITAGVAVDINPLLPAPVTAGVLWTADGNNRATPNYAAATT